MHLSTQSNTISSYATCNWVAAFGDSREVEKFFYSNLQNNILCENQTIDAEVMWNVTCIIDSAKIVYTSLVIISPLQAGLWKIFVECRQDLNSDFKEMSSTIINVSSEYELSFVFY